MKKTQSRFVYHTVTAIVLRIAARGQLKGACTEESTFEHLTFTAGM